MLDSLWVALLRIHLHDDEEGQTSIEYALVLIGVVLVLAAALALGLTGALDTAITKIKAALS